MDSPIGELHVAVTRRGLIRVLFQEESIDEVIDSLARDVSPRVMASAALTDLARGELDAYFAKRLDRFSIRTDRRLIRGIGRDVLNVTSRIRYGTTSTYGEVAARIRRPTASPRSVPAESAFR